MTRLPLAFGALAIGLAAASPAMAGPMTKSQKAALARCQAAPKKSTKCVAMMKAHSGDAMMAHDGAMAAPEGSMMSAEKPK